MSNRVLHYTCPFFALLFIRNCWDNASYIGLTRGSSSIARVGSTYACVLSPQRQLCATKSTNTHKAADVRSMHLSMVGVFLHHLYEITMCARSIACWTELFCVEREVCYVISMLEVWKTEASHEILCVVMVYLLCLVPDNELHFHLHTFIHICSNEGY